MTSPTPADRPAPASASPDVAGMPSSSGAPGMRFTVDAWDPSYGSSLESEEIELAESTARIDVDVELPADRWRPQDPAAGAPGPPAVLFVDGVRRIEARMWIDEVADGGGPATEASPAICASYAGGVVCCCAAGAHVLTVDARRGLFTIASHAVDVTTSAGVYTACRTAASPTVPLSMTLSAALQQRLAEVELEVAVSARAALTEHGVRDGDLLVADGPLRGRTHLPRAVGFIKSHRTIYLPHQLNTMVGSLTAGQRTPVFLMGTSWDRHSWYLRLPCRPGSPWAGVVRVECSADLQTPQVVDLANLSQATLCRYASSEYKDARAPQNLYPIAGLEKALRRQLGDPRLLHRALRTAAA